MRAVQPRGAAAARSARARRRRRREPVWRCDGVEPADRRRGSSGSAKPRTLSSAVGASASLGHASAGSVSAAEPRLRAGGRRDWSGPRSIGIGQTHHKKVRDDLSMAGLVREAAERALEDAEMDWGDIDADRHRQGARSLRGRDDAGDLPRRRARVRRASRSCACTPPAASAARPPSSPRTSCRPACASVC